MGHVFDILTTLDPSFLPAYVFGAFALAQEGGDFPAAERLMLKGLAANPTSGELAFQLGFLYYVRPGGRDLQRAAEYFEQASRQADGPPQSARFAAFARQNAGNLTAAYELWSRVERTSPNRYLREIAQREMARIREALAQGRHELAMRRLTTPGVLLGEAGHEGVLRGAPGGPGRGPKVRSREVPGRPITLTAGRPPGPGGSRVARSSTRCRSFHRERPESPAVQPAVPGQARTASRE